MTHTARYGYTLMTEQSGPREIVRYAAGAEQAGFDFEVMSDHYSPWLASQGHAGYAWSMLGAVTQVTFRKEVLDQLGVRPGDRITVEFVAPGRVEVTAARPQAKLESRRKAVSSATVFKSKSFSGVGPPAVPCDSTAYAA